MGPNWFKEAFDKRRSLEVVTRLLYKLTPAEVIVISFLIQSGEHKNWSGRKFSEVKKFIFMDGHELLCILTNLSVKHITEVRNVTQEDFEFRIRLEELHQILQDSTEESL